MRDLLQQSATCLTTHIISRELTYENGPWEQTNRDSVLEQGYEASDLPTQAHCPNKNCTQGKPVVVSGIRNLNNPASPRWSGLVLYVGPNRKGLKIGKVPGPDNIQKKTDKNNATRTTTCDPTMT